MHVIGHQYVRMHGAAVFERSFGKFAQETRIVGGRSEAGLAIIAALHDMLCDAWQIDAWQSGHVLDDRRVTSPHAARRVPAP